MDPILDLYITVNSPGEIAGYAAPVVRELRIKMRGVRITIVILPCQYASGAERELSSGVGADRIVRIGAVGKMIGEDAASGSRPRSNMVLHLGGDVFFSVYLSRRLKATLWAYCSRPRWGRFVEKFFVPDERAERRFAILNFPHDRFERIGHLALDSVQLNETEDETRRALGADGSDQIIAYMTGSRPIEYLNGTPFFARVASMIDDRIQGLRHIFPIAPSVDEEGLKLALASHGMQWRGEARVREIILSDRKSAQVVRGRTLEVLNCAKLAIAVPGTNNLQSAALYTPTIMVLPFDKADEFPLDGIAGILPLWFPGVRKIKKRLIVKLNERTEFISIPNRMAGKMLLPELRGDIDEADVAHKAIALLNSPDALQSMSRAFWELTHERGAAAHLADSIVKWARANSGARKV